MSTNTHNIDEHGKRILNEVMASLHDSDDPTEFHLPVEVTKLDKAALLAIIYRLLARCQ